MLGRNLALSAFNYYFIMDFFTFLQGRKNFNFFFLNATNASLLKSQGTALTILLCQTLLVQDMRLITEMHFQANKWYPLWLASIFQNTETMK